MAADKLTYTVTVPKITGRKMILQHCTLAAEHCGYVILQFQ